MTDTFLDAAAACRLIGGTRPVHRATLYRGVRQGIFPKPVKVSAGISRWRRDELEAALQKRMAERETA